VSTDSQRDRPDVHDEETHVAGDDLQTEDDSLGPGTMVGEYRVDSVLGSGTFGDVYSGEQPLIGKLVAIKVLKRRFSSDPQMVSRFVSEARAVNRIRNRNIIDIFSFGTLPDRRHYFVMEWLQGVTLSRFVERTGRLTPAGALPILRGVAEALEAAHQAGIAHRDLKPDNIFIVEEEAGGPSPKLLDFGIAKLLGQESATHKTATGVPVGTPTYMSPEQCRGMAMDHRTDIYSFGVLTHRLLTGRLPFEANVAMDLMVQHTSEPPPRMSSVCSTLPPQLDLPVLAMLEKKSANRPPTMAEAFNALLAAMVAAGIAAPAEPMSTQHGERSASRTGDVPPSVPTVVLSATIAASSEEGAGSGGVAPGSAAADRTQASAREATSTQSSMSQAMNSGPDTTLRSGPSPSRRRSVRVAAGVTALCGAAVVVALSLGMRARDVAPGEAGATPPSAPAGVGSPPRPAELPELGPEAPRTPRVTPSATDTLRGEPESSASGRQLPLSSAPRRAAPAPRSSGVPAVQSASPRAARPRDLDTPDEFKLR
jgi:eukaryotic-like serine/threonine-protein kinase